MMFSLLLLNVVGYLDTFHPKENINDFVVMLNVEMSFRDQNVKQIV